MRIPKPGLVATLVILVAACSSGASGSATASRAPDGQASAPAGQPSAAPSGPAGGAGTASAGPSVAPGSGASPSQAAGGGGTSTGWASKPCALLTEAEVAGILHGAMVAASAPGVDAFHGACNYTSEESGNEVTVHVAEGAAAKSQFDQGAAAGYLGSAVDGLGDTAFYTDGELSIWKGDHGVGITIEQSDPTDDAGAKALAVALGKIAVGRL